MIELLLVVIGVSLVMDAIFWVVSGMSWLDLFDEMNGKPRFE